MVRQLTSAELLITRIEGKNFAYIKPEIGNFSATRTVTDVSIEGNISDKANPLAIKEGDVYLEDISAEKTRIGIKFEHDGDIRVYNYQFKDTVGTQTQPFAAAIKRDDDHVGAAEFLRVYADGQDFSRSGRFDPNFNTDFFDNNNSTDAKGGAVFFRDVTLKNFHDAAFDAKSDVYIMNATIDGTTTGLRTWPGNDIYIVNSEVRGGANSFLAKFTGDTGKIYHYNTTWNGKDNPDLSEVTTWKVPLNQANSVKRNNIIELDKNPLPNFDPFFTIDNGKYFLQVSVDGGRWRDIDVPNNGFLSTHIGDTLIPLPNLGSGDYRLRAWTVERGRESNPAVSEEFVVSGGGVSVNANAAPPPTIRKDDAPSAPDLSPIEASESEVVASGVKNAKGGYYLSGDKTDEVFITSRGDDEIRTGHGHDLIVFDTTKDIGDDRIVDFNRGRDALLFTEFVRLGCNGVQKLDSSGRFVLDDPALDANGGTIALGSQLADRFIYYNGETVDGLHAYSIWNRPWSEIPDCTSAQDNASKSGSGDTARTPAVVETASAQFPSQENLATLVSKASRDNVVSTGGRNDDFISTTAGNDQIVTGWGHDLILFNTARDVGDDVIVDFNRGRDALLFTQYVDLGSDTVERLDNMGRFVLDNPDLDANGGTIALGSNLANRYIHYSGQTEDGLFVYEIWNRPWDEIPG